MPPYARWSGPEEQKRWAESVEADLAREPTWGALIRRRYTDELRYFASARSAGLTQPSATTEITVEDWQREADADP